jgi:hypothetical protein
MMGLKRPINRISGSTNTTFLNIDRNLTPDNEVAIINKHHITSRSPKSVAGSESIATR